MKTKTINQSDSGSRQKIRWSVVALLSILAITLCRTVQANDFDDKAITQAIDDEYLIDTSVPFNDIDVTTVDGIVSLEGIVDNLLAKKRAALIAETVRGVRSISNRLVVKPSNDLLPSDLENQISDALLYDDVTERYEIKTTVDSKGTVTLQGTVDSWKEKQFAAEVVSGVEGVTARKNELEVDHKSERSDAEIRAEIVRGLEWNTLVDDSLINVRVKKGEVTLSGLVGSLAEKRQAIGNAWVRGTEYVDSSELNVERWARDEDLREDKFAFKHDTGIVDALNDAFRHDPRVDDDRISATSQRGIVNLRGTVNTLRAKEAAETIANHTVGVISVNNYIKVRPETQYSDRFVEKLGRMKFQNSPWVEEDDVHISLSNGVARLSGTVDSIFEKAYAETLAQQVTGIKSIKNLITVADTQSVVVYDPYIWSYYPYPWSYYNSPRPIKAEIFGATKSDTETAKKIVRQLYWSPFIDHEDVTVVVENGIATLTGVVESRKEKDAAFENALEGGALVVKNLLQVES